MSERIVVNNAFFPKIEKQLECFRADSYRVVPELDIIRDINIITNTTILAYGYEFYSQFRNTVSHIGMRNFTYNDFCDVPIISFGDGNKLVFGRYPLDSLDDTNSTMRQSMVDPEFWMYIDPKLDFFMSRKVEKEFVTWPKVKVVGLNDAVQELLDNWIPYIGKEGVGIDFESSGFPDENTFILSGVSLASAKRQNEDGTFGYSVWIDFRKDDNYENRTDVRDHNEFMKVFYSYIKNNSNALWAFNCSFEIHALYWMFEETFYIQDAMALCVCDNQRKSLKYEWQYYGLGNSWDDFQDIQRNALIKLFKTYTDFDRYIEDKNSIVDLLDDTGTVIGKQNKVKASGINADALPDDKYIKNYWGEEWLAVDPGILGPYCCYDAFAGLKLAELLLPSYKYPYQVFLYNKYFQYELATHRFNVDIKLRDELYGYYSTVERNYNIFVDHFKAKRVKVREDKEKRWSDIECSPIIDRLISECPAVITPDPLYFAKDLIGHLLSLPENAEMFDKLDNEGIFDTHIFDKLFGIDYSSNIQWMVDEYLTEEGWEPVLDELGNQVIDENGNPAYRSIGMVESICTPPNQYIDHKHDGYKAFNRKRGMFKRLGLQLFTEIPGLNIPEWIGSFNKSILPDVIKKHKEWMDKNINNTWVLSIPPTNSYYNIMDLRKIKNNGQPKYPQYEDWMSIPQSEDGFGINESDFRLIKMMPQELVDKLYYAIDLTDPSVLSIDLKNSGVLPDEVSVLLNDAPDYLQYIEYRSQIKLLDDINKYQSDNHRIDQSSSVPGGKEWEESYIPKVNIWSYVKQAPEWLNSFKTDEEVVKSLALIRFYWEYRAKNFSYIIPAYGHGRHQDDQGNWVINDPPDIDYDEKGEPHECVPGYFTYWDWPEFVKQFNIMWDNGSVHTHPLFKELMSKEWKAEIWMSDLVGANLVYTAIIDINELKTTEIPDDINKAICKWACLYDVTAAAKKALHSYIEHFYARTGIPYQYSHKWHTNNGSDSYNRNKYQFDQYYSVGDEYMCADFDPI